MSIEFNSAKNPKGWPYMSSCWSSHKTSYYFFFHSNASFISGCKRCLFFCFFYSTRTFSHLKNCPQFPISPSPEPAQAESQQTLSRAQPAEMAPGSGVPRSRLSPLVHWGYLCLLSSQVHLNLMYHKVWPGVGSLSLLAQNRHQNRCLKHFHLSNILMCRLWTVGWCSQKHLMEGYHPVTLEQSSCKDVVSDGTSSLQLWLLSDNGSSGTQKLLA